MTNDIIYNAVSNTASSVVEVLRYINNKNCPSLANVRQQLDVLDIDVHINTIQQFISELGDNPSISVKNIIISIHDILQLINQELFIIKRVIDEHTQKYFYNYRTINIQPNLDKIKKDFGILINRYNLMINLLLIKK